MLAGMNEVWMMPKQTTLRLLAVDNTIKGSCFAHNTIQFLLFLIQTSLHVNRQFLAFFHLFISLENGSCASCP